MQALYSFRKNINEPRRRMPRGRFLMLLLMSVLCIMTPATECRAQTPQQREAKIKAAYLYQFIRYIQWPAASFTSQDAPLVIGTIGNDPVCDYVRLIVRKRTAGNRTLSHLPLSDASQASKCHILFISDTADPNLVSNVMRSASQMPILLVGEQHGFISSGGIITFTIAGNNVRLRLSMQHATARGMKISSQLAKIAEVVD